jgi:hypothetical protein
LVPGVVLAVSPDNSMVLVNDQKRQVLYIYSVSGSSITSTYGGMGASAQWTPDSKTLYISDSASLGGNHANTLYEYNANTGWTVQSLTASGGATQLALTSPSVGAYLSGYPTVAHTWCPTGTAGDYASMSFYPQGDTVDVQSDVLAATTDGNHVISAALASGAVTLTDIGVTVPTTPCPLASTGAMTALEITHSTPVQAAVTATATSLTGMVTAPSPVSSGTNVAATSVSFLTYEGTTTGATLPYYLQSTTASSVGTLGTVGYVTLTGADQITAPIAGTFSPDDTQFFVSTSGDNELHFISTTSLTDTTQFTPALPACTVGDTDCTLTATPASGIVPVTVIQVKPRSTT